MGTTSNASAVMKFDPAGVLQWAAVLDGDVRGERIADSGDGGIFVAGTLNGMGPGTFDVTTRVFPGGTAQACALPSCLIGAK